MSTISNLTATNAPHWETSENHGPLVSVITWFLVVTAFLSVLARVATRFAVVRQFLAIGQSITTSLQASHGLGEHIDSVSPGRLAQFQKTTYASGFLYIGALTAIKISICLHLTSLTPVQLHRTIILALGAFVCVWMVSCFFIIGFQCHLPHPWQFVEGQCIDTAGFWTYAHIINILTDSALIVLPWLILSRLQMKATRKYIIIGCFTARVFVIAATIVQICFLRSRTASSQDLTFDLWTVALLTSIVQALSLIAACIPYLKPFMGALETGMIRVDGGAPSRGHVFGYGNRSTKEYMKYGNFSKPSSKPSHSQLGNVRMDNLGFSGVKMLGDSMLNKQTAAVSTKGQSLDSDNDSQTSQSKIIRKTIGWSVTEEPQIPPHTHLEFPSRTQYERAV